MLKYILLNIKIMEADAILKLVEYSLHNCCFIINFKASDYYITMQAMLKNKENIPKAKF